MKSRVTKSATLLMALLVVSPLGLAQFKRPEPLGPPPPAQKSAPIDLTGYWVSVISEDWRFRMLTAPKGDAEGAPLKATARKAMKSFDPAKYGPDWTNKIDCRAYYGANLLRMPTRLHITWATPDTLQIESDWGQQIRLIHFKKAELPDSATIGGSSFGQWQTPIDSGGSFGFPSMGPPPPPANGKLLVATDKFVPGWLRRNGVPYSDKTVMHEWFQVFKDTNGVMWFDVTSKIEDPEYLSDPMILSSDFRKEPDGKKWAPHPCVQMP